MLEDRNGTGIGTSFFLRKDFEDNIFLTGNEGCFLQQFYWTFRKEICMKSLWLAYKNKNTICEQLSVQKYER
jgi:hypothetical protein